MRKPHQKCDSQLPALLNLALAACLPRCQAGPWHRLEHVSHPEIPGKRLMRSSLSGNVTKASYLEILDGLSKNKSMHCSVRSCHQSSESHQQGEARLPALHLSSFQRTVPSLWPRACRSGLSFFLPASVHLRFLCSKYLLDVGVFSLAHLFHLILFFPFFLSSLLLSSLAHLLSFPLASSPPLVLSILRASLEVIASCDSYLPWFLEI